METTLEGRQCLKRRSTLETLLPPKKRKIQYLAGIPLQVNSFLNTHDGNSLSGSEPRSSCRVAYEASKNSSTSGRADGVISQLIPALQKDQKDASSIPFSPRRALRATTPKSSVAKTIRRAREKQEAIEGSTAEAVARKVEEENKLQLRQKEREAARIQLEKIEKTVEFDDYFHALHDLEKMGYNLTTYGYLPDDELYQNPLKWSFGHFL